MRNNPPRALFAIVVALVICLSDITATVRAMGTYDEIFYSGNNIVWYDPRCNDESSAKIVQLAGKDNTEKILNFFMRKGLSLAQSAGIVGNMMQESGLNPAIIQGGKIADDSYVLQSGVGFGLVQWTSGGRQQKFMKFMKEELGVGVTNLSGQLEFVWKEMNESYGHTLRALKATQDPVEAAVAVHGPPSPGYEASADTPAAVRSVRGGNAKKVYDKYNDAPALAGSTAASDMTPAGDGTDADISAAMSAPESKNGTKSESCKELESGGGTALGRTIGNYAWDTFKGNDINAKPEYKEAVVKALNEKRYVGGTTNSTRGIDCGGFVSLAIQDSGYDKAYNSGKGNTITQEKWLKDNWRPLTKEEITGPKQTGDVAINEDHTYLYVDKKDVAGGKFQTNIASASLDERAPMAGKESPTDTSYRWYRKKI